MKRSLYKTAYRTVSWLADRSNGLALFVKWKVALAVIIIGFSTTVLTSCVGSTECYAQVPPPGEETEEQAKAIFNDTYTSFPADVTNKNLLT